jgi:hypothetical protein
MDDQRFIGVLDATDDYLTAINELQAALKSGFFNLARARYSMGPTKVQPVVNDRSSASYLSPLIIWLKYKYFLCRFAQRSCPQR